MKSSNFKFVSRNFVRVSDNLNLGSGAKRITTSNRTPNLRHDAPMLVSNVPRRVSTTIANANPGLKGLLRTARMRRNRVDLTDGGTLLNLEIKRIRNPGRN